MMNATIQPKAGFGFALTTGALGLLLGASPAQAQNIDCEGAEFPCGLQIEEVGVLPVPALLKFQARVSQSKIPVGAGTFKKVEARIVSGTQIMCAEKFRDVQVRDGVMNLSIGENLDCDLGEVIAENGDLMLQTCMGEPPACLRGIPLTPAAYAIKSRSAGIAQHAHEVDQAAQATYTRRLSADDALFEDRALSAGYLDFTSPAGNDAGWLTWVPVAQRSGLSLQFVDKSVDGDISPLDELVLASEETRIEGRLNIAPAPDTERIQIEVQNAGLHVVGASAIDGSLQQTQALTVDAGGYTVAESTAEITGDVLIRGHVAIDAPLTVGTGMTVQSGGLTIAANGLSVSGTGLINGNTTSRGPLPIGGAVTVESGGFDLSSGSLNVAGAATFHNDLVVGGRHTPLGGLRVGVGGLEVRAGNLEVSGSARFGGDLAITQSVALSSATEGDLTVEGTFDSLGLAVAGTTKVNGAVRASSRVFMRDIDHPDRLRVAMDATGDPANPRVEFANAGGVERIRVFPRIFAEDSVYLGAGNIELQDVNVSGETTLDGFSTVIFHNGGRFGDGGRVDLRVSYGAIAGPNNYTRFNAPVSTTGPAEFRDAVALRGNVNFAGTVSYYHTQSCPVGLEPNGAGRCDDTNECLRANNGGCGNLKYCINTYGGFRCIDP